MVDSPGDSEPDEIANAVFRALSNTERRYVLYYLRARRAVDVDELATVVAGWLGARESDQGIVDPEDRKRVRIRLYHDHLPRLADEGFVRYDRERAEVELEPVPETLDTVLDLSLQHERDATVGYDPGPNAGR